MAFLQQLDQPERLNQRLAQSAWLPVETVGVPDRSPRRCKTKQVEQRLDESLGIFARLKATVLGRFYVSHLKQYRFVRWLVIWGWRNAYPVYVNYLSVYLKNKNAKRWRKLISLSDFTKSRGLTTTQLVDATVVETPAPKVFPESDQGYLESPHDRYSAPAVYVAPINNGVIHGGSNLILTQDAVICHDLHDFKRDYTSEELHGRILIAPQKGRIRWLLHDELPEQMPAAAAFVDSCASNYAHWLTEVLPRIAVFCDDERFKGIPIVVNDGLHKNIIESLFLVVGAEREVFTLPIGRAIQVGLLYLTSVAGYVPFERRNNKLAGHSHGVFNPRAFELIRKKLPSLIEGTTKQAWPEKIYLRRNSGVRKVTNSAELEDFLVARGYVVVEPEKLLFTEQVRLFNNASEIISPTGAALSNAFFCKPGTQITVLMSKHPDMIYRYWCNMLTPIGMNVRYVLGNNVGGSNAGIHGDFMVDVADVMNLFETNY